jgi:hypothetical protein
MRNRRKFTFLPTLVLLLMFLAHKYPITAC